MRAVIVGPGPSEGAKLYARRRKLGNTPRNMRTSGPYDVCKGGESECIAWHNRHRLNREETL